MFIYLIANHWINDSGGLCLSLSLTQTHTHTHRVIYPYDQMLCSYWTLIKRQKKNCPKTVFAWKSRLQTWILKIIPVNVRISGRNCIETYCWMLNGPLSSLFVSFFFSKFYRYVMFLWNRRALKDLNYFIIK